MHEGLFYVDRVRDLCGTHFISSGAIILSCKLELLFQSYVSVLGGPAQAGSLGINLMHATGLVELQGLWCFRVSGIADEYLVTEKKMLFCHFCLSIGGATPHMVW